MSHRSGKVIIPASITPWDHELKTAHALARHGFTVEFVAVGNSHRAKTADVIIDGTFYEIKSPKTDKLSAVERNLKRATRQSSNIIIDSRRMSKLHDATIQKFLFQKLKQQKTIKKILFVNRKHEVIDISDTL
ncbi:MAG TPA: hypothetical protein VJR27_02635 [Candidatus Saccharimonadales bacterium]|nr:hypothetical protein [Candidatus Saccharimonadales bacterium]